MQAKIIVNKVVAQSHLLGRWWGNLNTIAQHTNIYIQFLILAFSATSAYAVVMQSLHQWGYEMPFWIFALLVALSIGILALFVWRLSIPSTFETWNFQWYHHGNLLRKRLDERDEEIDRRYKYMCEKVLSIEKELKMLRGELKSQLLEKNADERINKVYSEKG